MRRMETEMEGKEARPGLCPGPAKGQSPFGNPAGFLKKGGLGRPARVTIGAAPLLQETLTESRGDGLWWGPGAKPLAFLSSLHSRSTGLKPMLLLAAGLAVLAVAACGKRGAPSAPGPADQVTYPRTYPTE